MLGNILLYTSKSATLTHLNKLKPTCSHQEIQRWPVTFPPKDPISLNSPVLNQIAAIFYKI